MGENMIQYLAEGKQSQTLERKEKEAQSIILCQE